MFYTPENEHVPQNGTILVGNTSEPTIDFQGTAVRFQGSTCQSPKMVGEAMEQGTFFSVSRCFFSLEDPRCIEGVCMGILDSGYLSATQFFSNVVQTSHVVLH